MIARRSLKVEKQKKIEMTDINPRKRIIGYALTKTQAIDMPKENTSKNVIMTFVAMLSL